jgi:putative transposase
MKTQKKAKPFSDEAIDELLKQGQTAGDINGLLKQFTKAVLERAMQGELTHHLGYAKRDPSGNNSGNSRNGVTRKTLKGDFGEVELETPRDRNGEFAPQIVQKNQTRWTGFDDKILSLYARGMIEQASKLQDELYGVPIFYVAGGYW